MSVNIDTSKLDLDEVVEAAEQSMFGDELTGFCTACGEQAWNVEPDAHGYRCQSCGQPAVYGAEELVLLMVP